MSDEQHDAPDEGHTDTKPETPAAKRTRSGPRPLSEKLEELAGSARARIDRLRAREHKLVTELGKVRTELQAARAELEKITGAAPAHPPPQPSTTTNGAQAADYNGAPF